MQTIAMMLMSCVITAPGNPSPNPPTPSDCDTLVTDVQIELEDIQSCDRDADCGQVLAGTSCGCTRNLVARNDADVATFEDLAQDASDAQCDVGFSSPCDCPEADGYRCADGTCTWNYAFDAIGDCDGSESDAFTLNSLSLDGDELLAEVEYSGGCEDHTFTLCWPNQSFQESDPVQAALVISHDDPDDPCDSIVTETRRFPLASLRSSFEAAYPNTDGEIRVRVGDEEVLYTF